MEYCKNSNIISGRSYRVGGICGDSYNRKSTANILRCYNTGYVINYNRITGRAGYTGGVCGVIDGDIISQCYNTGKVTSNYEAMFTVGICGYAIRGGIKECYNSGDVTSTYNIVGGVAGYLSQDCVIENCYNIGANSGAAGVGGVWADSSATNTMKNCYNTGSVTGDSNTYHMVNDLVDISNVYYYCDFCKNTDKVNTGSLLRIP